MNEKPVASVPCPGCNPDPESKWIKTFSGKFVRNRSLWEDHFDVYRCTNCGYERPRRQIKNRSGITKSQERAIERVRTILSEDARGGELHRFEYELLDWGVVSLVVDTREHPLTNVHFHMFIGRRGGVEIKSYSAITDAEHNRSMLEWYQKRMRK